MEKLVRVLYWLKSVWAVVAALLVASVLVAMAGSGPTQAFAALFHGALFDKYGFATSLVKMSPMLLAALAVVLPLRAGLFNLGAEGQIYLGALFATMAALYLPGLPGPVHIIVCSMFGAIGGAVWAYIPAYLKATRGVNEVIVTLLLNYVGVNLVSFFVSGPMMETGAPYPYSSKISQSLHLPLIIGGTDAHVGAVIGVVIAIVLWIIFRHTSVGFSLDAVGQNTKAASYAGMSVKRHVILSLVRVAL